MKRSAKKGFTLIELIIVIAILAILAMVIIPRITGVKNNAEVSKNRTNAKTIQNALEQYYADFEGYPNVVSVNDLQTKLKSGYLKALPHYKDDSDAVIASYRIFEKADCATGEYTAVAAGKYPKGYRIKFKNDAATQADEHSDDNDMTPGAETSTLFKN